MRPVASFFFFNDTATTEIYTLSLHDALPISTRLEDSFRARPGTASLRLFASGTGENRKTFDTTREKLKQDRKSTRLNSSHGYISYAVFCLKKKKQTPRTT